ncbi:MAG: outer membrane protein assembly factor BamD [Spirochaetales bacterium]|nr:outer membrane protein assembly factor BamD [Spirochaetales bacterium]
MLNKKSKIDCLGISRSKVIGVFCVLCIAGICMAGNLYAEEAGKEAGSLGKMVNGDDGSAVEDFQASDIYIEALEALADEEMSLAKTKLIELQERFPGSQYLPKAEEYLFDITQRKSNAGIVPFYLGNLITTTYSAVLLPYVLGYDFDAILGGLTGLAGVASGLGSARLMSRDYPVSSHQAWWIESIQLISLGNYFYGFNSIDPYDFLDYDTADRLFQAGIISTALTSRGIGYALNRDKSPSKGKAAFMLQSYAWSNVYYWLFTAGVLESDYTRGNNIGALLVTDAALAGSLPLWENLHWSSLRTGLVTVGGLGGGLLGFFSNIILLELFDLTGPASAGIMMGSALAGQAAAVYFTKNMEDERSFESPQVVNSRSKGIAVMPAVSAERGMGLQVCWSW